MIATKNDIAFDINITKQAADNWYSRTSVREDKLRALKLGYYDKTESKERLVKHANRLIKKVKEAVPVGIETMSEDLRELIEQEPIEEDELDNFFLERVLGATRDFLSFEFFEGGIQANKCVGRIVHNIGHGRKSYGTGFLVSPRLMMTNCHVLHSAEAATNSVIEFDYQLDLSKNPYKIQQFKLDPEAFFLNNKQLDFALVAVQEQSKQGASLQNYGFCPLIAEEGKIIFGEAVNIIQHPSGQMKQVVIRENKLVDVLDNFLHYEADTEPGSSGSPVFNDQWEIVALHHSGVPKMDTEGNLLNKNGRIWHRGDDPALLDWVGNEGIRVSRLIAFITDAAVGGKEKHLKEEMIQIGKEARKQALPQISNNISLDKRNSSTGSLSMESSINLSTGTVTVTIPLNITVSLGSLSSKSANNGSLSDESFLEEAKPDNDYGTRPGYDPNFLGFPVPLPKLTSFVKGQALEVSNADSSNKYELKYYHYSVIMSRQRKLAFLAAVNLDAKPKFKYSRERKDKWYFDPRIPERFQAGNDLYANNPIDRGHLVRRADAAWGNTLEEAELANDDTFHLTNCSPQHEIFNQSDKATRKGFLLWGNLENHITQQGTRGGNEKLCIFNGPIFRFDDRKYRGVQLPREFWKVVVYKNGNGNPSSLAFVLSQEQLIKNFPEEEFEVGPYKCYQLKVSQLEYKTGLDFGIIRSFDLLEATGNESYFEEGTEVVPLAKSEDIIF